MALASIFCDFARKALGCEKWLYYFFLKKNVMARNACMGDPCSRWFPHGLVEFRELVAYWGRVSAHEVAITGTL